jgi:hypothetical protein
MSILSETQNEEEEGWEEYYDYIFPDDEDTKKTIKMISRALDYYKNANNQQK